MKWIWTWLSHCSYGVYMYVAITECMWFLTHSEQRPQNIYSHKEINLDNIINLATEISLFSLQISNT